MNDKTGLLRPYQSPIMRTSSKVMHVRIFRPPRRLSPTASFKTQLLHRLPAAVQAPCYPLMCCSKVEARGRLWSMFASERHLSLPTWHVHTLPLRHQARQQLKTLRVPSVKPGSRNLAGSKSKVEHKSKGRHSIQAYSIRSM